MTFAGRAGGWYLPLAPIVARAASSRCQPAHCPQRPGRSAPPTLLTIVDEVI
jgi:hypothetical protein